MTKKIFLVDGSGYIFRAFYAVTHLTTKDGFPTNALYGFTRMLGKLLNDSDSDHIIVVFDAGRKTFRNDLYPEYKANRTECPEELRQQMPHFREISRALGLQVIESPGYEADDVIATLVERFKESDREIVIVSGDKDLSQLVSDRVSVWDTMRDRRFGRDGVIEKFGVPPEQVVEVLALMGDTSDNVPGLKGVGPKTAAQLIQKYGDVESIIGRVEEIRKDTAVRGREKIADEIASSGDKLRLSRRLVEVLRDAPFELTIDGRNLHVNEANLADLERAAERLEVDGEELTELFSRFEFLSLLKELKLEKKTRKKRDTNFSYRTVYEDEFDSFLNSLRSQKEFAFDVETTSLDPFLAKLVGVSFCWDDKEAWYVPLSHKVSPEGRLQVGEAQFLQKTADIFRSSEWKKCGQNVKYDINVLGAKGVEVDGVDFDSMIAAYLLHPDRGAFNLTALAKEYLGIDVIEYEELEGVEGDFSNVSIEDATRYSAEDAHMAWLLKGHLEPLLEENNLTKVFSEIEVPLVPVLSRLERAGVKIDTKILSNMSDEFGAELEEIRGRLVAMAGVEFNLNSPKQLADILFVKMGIPTKGVKKTKTGFSTDSSVLELLSEQYEFPREVLRYRMLFKLKSTYVDSLPQQISVVTDRLHSRFNQTVTATGRLSSSDPNLQNIPIVSKEGRRIRGAFVCGANKTLISADYSQIELRLLAHMSNDANLIQAFVDEVDIHAKTARELFHLRDSEDVTPEQRRIGKTLNFGIIYGMSGFRLSKELGVPVKEGDRYIQNYFSRYPGVKEFFAKLENDAATLGYVQTLFGRRRMISEADFSGRDKGFQNRIAINAPIQGTAADLVKLAMIRIDERSRREKLPFFMILQVHDELVFECDSTFSQNATEIIKNTMEHVCQLSVPLKVEVGVGGSWEEAH